MVVGLLPLCFSDLRLPWNNVVGATDACEGGMGRTEATWPVDAVKAAGRTSERWRFRRHPEGRDRREDQMSGARHRPRGFYSAGERR